MSIREKNESSLFYNEDYKNANNFISKNTKNNINQENLIKQNQNQKQINNFNKNNIKQDYKLEDENYSHENLENESESLFYEKRNNQYGEINVDLSLNKDFYNNYEGENFSENLNNEKDLRNQKKIGKWSLEEDDLLTRLVEKYGLKNWKKISQYTHGRSSIQCLHRWTKILQPGLTKGPWTIEEDRRLLDWVKIHGPSKWTACSEHIVGRSGKQCRERWNYTLNPKIVKGNWKIEEDFKIFIIFKIFGGKWSKIACFFQGRTENAIKNRFYSTLRRKAAETFKQQNDEKKCKIIFYFLNLKHLNFLIQKI
jgi:hypothetical protein